MKRLILVLTTILILLVGQSYAFEEFDNGYKMYVRTTTIKTSSTDKNGEWVTTARDEYYIYIGTKETEELDKRLIENRIIINYMLSHPIEDIGYPEVPGGWYVRFTDTTRGINVAGPVFRQDVWNTLPKIIKHILVALDYKDKNLLIISANIASGSISIFYHPKFDRFKIFYDIKLKILERYFDKYNVHNEVPILIEPTMMI